MPINQPSNQIKLTNVSIVRLKKGGKRFEIACYKNKVLEWRNNVETDLDNVVQISNVFVNVSKGEVAKANDLRKSFKTDETNQIIEEILRKGELQVGEMERELEISNLFKEIAVLVAGKCVNPTDQQPYPVSLIEKAMKEAGFNVRQDKSAKSQVSQCITSIQKDSNLPIERAKMRVRVTLPNEHAELLKDQIFEAADTVEVEEMGEEEWETILLIDPSQFRVINELMQKACKGQGRIETLDFNATGGATDVMK